MKAYLEHINVTVKDPDKLSALLCRLFDWKVRWSGAALDNGSSVHVGNDDSYLALYTHENTTDKKSDSHLNHLLINNLNHLGIVVSDLDKVELNVKAEGYEPCSHGDYEPGRRFYFHVDQLEIEIVEYS